MGDRCPTLRNSAASGEPCAPCAPTRRDLPLSPVTTITTGFFSLLKERYGDGQEVEAGSDGGGERGRQRGNNFRRRLVSTGITGYPSEAAAEKPVGRDGIFRPVTGEREEGGKSGFNDARLPYLVFVLFRLFFCFPSVYDQKV